jgi:glyoxylase-like metal-dependent hydrolase (beta-lactamase superfamily II)
VFNFDEFLLTGDFILNHSIGRFDWPGSSLDQMRISIDRFKKIHKLTNLPMYSGHGPVTDVQSELLYNPYLNGDIII